MKIPMAYSGGRRLACGWPYLKEKRKGNHKSHLQSMFYYYKGLGIVTTQMKPCLLFKVVVGLSVTQE